MSDSESEELDPEVQNLLDKNEQQRGDRPAPVPDEEGNDNSEGKFKIDVFYKNKVETLRISFESSDTVSKLAEAVQDQVTGGADNEDRGQGTKKRSQLIYRKSPLDFDKTLEYYNIHPKHNNGKNPKIHVGFHVVGGAAVSNMEEDEKKANSTKIRRQRLPDFKNEKRIKPSLKPDCIMGYDEKKLRVKMPCKHVFDPHTIYNIAKMTILNLTKSQVRCPIIECDSIKSIWDIDLLTASADLTEKERKKIDGILTKRALIHSGDFCECKGCNGLVAKPDDIKMIRVRCPEPECSGRSDFCWMCGKDWKGGGFQVCGNDDCQTQEINQVLQNCSMIKPEYLGGKVECPEMRHCPRCLTLVIWNKACKHMTCWGCNKEFCFVCLGLKDENNGWPCGSHVDQCPVAPRQKLK